MPDWICLKLWMAVCWKVSWKVDPLPLSVPLRLLDDEPPVVFDELQAASDKATAARAAPAIAAPWVRTRCMLNIPSQLPAECCEEDSPDDVRAGFGLAADDGSGRPEDLTGRLGGGCQARALHHVPVGHGIGIMERGQAVHDLDLGFITSMPRRRITRGACRPRAATALILLPHPGNASPLSGGFPGTTSADDELSHSVIMSA